MIPCRKLRTRKGPSRGRVSEEECGFCCLRWSNECCSITATPPRPGLLPCQHVSQCGRTSLPCLRRMIIIAPVLASRLVRGTNIKKYAVNHTALNKQAQPPCSYPFIISFFISPKFWGLLITIMLIEIWRTFSNREKFSKRKEIKL